MSLRDTLSRAQKGKIATLSRGVEQAAADFEALERSAGALLQRLRGMPLDELASTAGGQIEALRGIERSIDALTQTLMDRRADIEALNDGIEALGRAFAESSARTADQIDALNGEHLGALSRAVRRIEDALRRDDADDRDDALVYYTMTVKRDKGGKIESVNATPRRLRGVSGGGSSGG